MQYYQNNVGGMINLISSMKEHKIDKIIFSSSNAVYDSNISLPLKENSRINPINAYGTTKRVNERMLEELENSFDHFSSIILRYFNPIGAHPSGILGEDHKGESQLIVPEITKILKEKSVFLKIYGKNYATKDGTALRDYIHVMDLAKAHLLAVKNFYKFGTQVYNICTGKPTSVLELVECFKRASNRDIPYEFLDGHDEDVPVSYCDPEKATKELDFTASYTLDEMCQHSVKFIEMN